MAAWPALAPLIEQAGRPLVIDALRAWAEARRGSPEVADPAACARWCEARLAGLVTPSQRRVFNLTGTVLHTNLGRALLAEEAIEAAVAAMRSPTTLEYDLADGGRGERDDHISPWLCRLTGAEAATAVNNNAGAVLLLFQTFAGGRQAVVSRGELVEIGGSFRVPAVMERANAELVEVGTTNRTRLEDYERAIGENTGAILRAHPSNFRTLGFTAEVEIEALCALGPPVIDDLGSGALAEGVAALRDEPPVRRSVLAGAALTCFSGDKLLGGPQAGLLVGRAEAVAAARAHPLARAMRIDKLCLAALEATLRLYRDPDRARREIPVLAMLEVSEESLAARARRLAAAIAHDGVEVTRAVAKVGGGALPLLELEGPVVAVDPGGQGADTLAARLRAGEEPVVGRVQGGRLLLDPRTLTDEEAEAAGGWVGAVLRMPPDG